MWQLSLENSQPYSSNIVSVDNIPNPYDSVEGSTGD
jgi:hypothetical protein